MKIELSPRGFLTVFFHQYVKILLILLLFEVTGFYVIYTADRLYESSGSLLVKFGRDASPDIARAGDKADEVSQNDRREIMQSDAEILQSHDLLYAVVKETGVETLYPGLTQTLGGADAPAEVAIKKLLSGDLNVKLGQQSNIISVSLLNKNPDIAAKFLHRLFAVFIARQSDVYNNPHSKFLLDQVKNASSKLESSQHALADFKASMGVTSIDDEMSQLLKEKSDAETIVFEAIDESQSRISELEAKKAQLLTTYLSQSPQVKQLQESIDVAKRQLREQQEDLKGHTASAQMAETHALHSKPDSDKPALTANVGVLSARVQAINARITQLEALRNRYNDFVRQVQIDELNYKNIQVSGEEAQINDTLNQKNITRISVVDEPAVTMKPVRPRKKLILAISVIAGIVSSLGIALIIETLDESFSTPEQVAAVLSVPVMASFPAVRRI